MFMYWLRFFFCYLKECLHKENKNNINTQSPGTIQLKRYVLVFDSKFTYKLDSHMKSLECFSQDFFIAVHCLLMFCMFVTLDLSTCSVSMNEESAMKELKDKIFSHQEKLLHEFKQRDYIGKGTALLGILQIALGLK